MKRNKLSTALALATAMGGLAGGAFAPSASAVNIAAQNVGDVLIFPYYTARCHVSALGVEEDCWQTLINFTNTTNATLAVKLRFLEGYNSREVLDFTVVMSPHDVFAGYIDRGEGFPQKDTPARFVLAHGENTCTVPQVQTIVNGVPQPYLSFSTFGYAGVNSDHAAGEPSLDSGKRTYEGYIVAIVEGHSYENNGRGTSWVTEPPTIGRYVNPEPELVPPFSGALLPPTLINNTVAHDVPWVAYYAKHIPVGPPTAAPAPRNCALVRQAFTKAPFTQGGVTLPRIVWTANEFGEPVNALKGNYNFLNSKRGVAAGGSAVALANFVRISPNDNVPAPGIGNGTGLGAICTAPNMFFDPVANIRNILWAPVVPGGAWCPNLITAQSNEVGFDSLEPSFADSYSAIGAPPGFSATTLSISDPTSAAVIAAYPDRSGHLAVAEVLRAGSLINEWSFNPALGVSTEWVVTHPTKDFFVDNTSGNLSAINPRRFPWTFPPVPGGPNGPRPTAPFMEAFEGTTSGNSCNAIGLTAWNREEQGAVFNNLGLIESPRPRSNTQALCFETNVIQFSADRSIFDSALTLNLTDGFAPFAVSPMGWLNMNLAAAAAAAPGGPSVLNGPGLPAVGFMIKQRALQGDYFKNFGYLVDHSRRRVD